jgi:hypothetical protein
VAVAHMVEEVVSEEYAGLVLPGAANPDALRFEWEGGSQEAGGGHLPWPVDLD